ncbi:MAG: ACP S-malonyltransferase [Clostridia bacterium]|nr:ACP S-malonyltransferase [Clostridia bacterium]
MGKIAFVFSGQGDQYPGMGKELAENYPVATKVFAMCDEIRSGTSSQCFAGSEEELKETKNTQPCLFAMELAAATVLTDAGITPDAVAGFSLGEIVACTVAGFVDEKTGFRLVCKRGELMQQAAEQVDSAMAAVIKLSREDVERLCKAFSDVYPVNYNCPGQITVAGLASQMTDFAAAVKAAGGRAIPLKVKGGFHSPFMREASASFASDLEGAELCQGRVTLYSNLTAEPYTEDVVGLLSAQICHPVRWEDTVRNMIAAGIDTFIEIGPGKTLTNMIGKIDAGVKTYCVSDLSTILSEVAPC